jgi:hypothetical protein
MSVIHPETVAGDTWSGMAALAGSWIGGGANMVAMREVFEVDADLFGNFAVVDIAVGMLWMATLMVDGKPFPKVVRIRDLMSGAESVVTWERVEFGRRIPPSLLDLSALANRIRKGVDPVPLDALRDSAQREPVEKTPALEDERR